MALPADAEHNGLSAATMLPQADHRGDEAVTSYNLRSIK